MRPPMTAPGTMPSTTKSRSSARRPIVRAASAASTIAAKIAPRRRASPSGRRPPRDGGNGSKSKAITAADTTSSLGTPPSPGSRRAHRGRGGAETASPSSVSARPGATVARTRSPTLSTGRHFACRADAHRAVAGATIIRRSVAALGASDRRHAEGACRGATLGVVEATGGLRPTADPDVRPMGGRAGRLVGVGDTRDAIDGQTSPALSVRLLGRLEIVACGQPVRLAGRHAQALAALLALRPRPRLRDAIAADLWPDFDGPSASSLRQALWLVRTGLAASGVEPDTVLEVGQDTLGLRPELELETDVASFEALVAERPASVGQRPRALPRRPRRGPRTRVLRRRPRAPLRPL